MSTLDRNRSCVVYKFINITSQQTISKRTWTYLLFKDHLKERWINFIWYFHICTRISRGLNILLFHPTSRYWLLVACFYGLSSQVKHSFDILYSLLPLECVQLADCDSLLSLKVDLVRLSPWAVICSGQNLNQVPGNLVICLNIILHYLSPSSVWSCKQCDGKTSGKTAARLR